MSLDRKPAKGPEKKANRRGAARLAAVQALYQMDIGGAGINDIFAEFESHWLGNEVEGDKGGDAAHTALAMVGLKRRLAAATRAR